LVALGVLVGMVGVDAVVRVEWFGEKTVVRAMVAQRKVVELLRVANDADGAGDASVLYGASEFESVLDQGGFETVQWRWVVHVVLEYDMPEVLRGALLVQKVTAAAERLVEIEFVEFSLPCFLFLGEYLRIERDCEELV
jgi:hypothetical protein